MNLPETGYQEITHTADIALRCWARDLEGLFQQAARGMFDLMGVNSIDGGEHRCISVSAPDSEGLLVAFLTELLYLLESESIALADASIRIVEGALRAEGTFRKVQEVTREIKAVTYHNLVIHSTKQGFTVTIVFDV